MHEDNNHVIIASNVDETPTETPKEQESAKETTTKDSEKKGDTSTTTETATKEADKSEQSEEEKNPLVLEYLDKDFIYDVLSVPTVSRAEYRMVTFIMMWARENHIDYEFDTYGNIYLTKGKLAEGEFYPCVTSHLDTVQREQEAYAQCGIPLPLKERINAKGKHELYVQGTGIGADDKAGVLISLSLFKYVDKLKACFFLEEEIGMQGSKRLNKEWFKDVSYVIGWDSPDRNRAAFACSSELLFSKKFFESIKDTCKEHGVTDFRSEPFTDVKEIRSQTELICMNFGNGGYNAHLASEYVVLEDIDGACGLGVALLKTIDCSVQHKMKSKTCSYASTTDEDISYFCKSTNTYSNYGGYHYNSRGYNNTNNKTSATTIHKPDTTIKDEEKIEPKVLEYVTNRYETYIEEIQNKVEKREATILDSIKKLCEEKGVDYKDFLDIFLENPSTEPFSTAIEF